MSSAPGTFTTNKFLSPRKYPEYDCTHLNRKRIGSKCVHDVNGLHCDRVRAELEVAKQKTKEEDDVSLLPSVTKHMHA